MTDARRPGPAGRRLRYYETLRRLLRRVAACTEAVVIDAEKPGGTGGDRFLFDEAGAWSPARCAGVGACRRRDRDTCGRWPTRPRPYVARRRRLSAASCRAAG